MATYDKHADLSPEDQAHLERAKRAAEEAVDPAPSGGFMPTSPTDSHEAADVWRNVGSDLQKLDAAARVAAKKREM